MKPYQMRRHARRMRRYGLTPMVVIDSGNQLPDTVIVVAVRALWRYRSELAPVTVATTLELAALVLHAMRPYWWPWLAAVAVAASCVLVVAGHRAGLPRPVERLYAAAVALVAGCWLAAGVAVGPTRRPLPSVLLVAGVVLAVPWWAHRRRRARVRVERTLAAWPQIAQAAHLAGSRIQSAVVDVWGWRARVALARGQTIGDVVAKIPALESSLGTARGAVRVYPTPDARADRVELRVLTMDPHADAIAWPGPSATSVTEPIELGVFEDAAPTRVHMVRRHALFGGATGSGKSGGINVLMGNLSACRDVVIWGVDLKRGMELGPWAPCLDRLATSIDQARALLRDAVAVLEARAALLAEQGRRVWDPTPDTPALVIVIDEYAELSEEAPDAANQTDSIARRGRAVAVTLVAATQRPTQKAMGHGATRSQMDVRMCFRVRERRDVDLILGQGMLNAGWHAHTLNAPGKFLLSAPEHDTPRRARAYLLTDSAVAEIARRHAADRPALDEVSRHAIDLAHLPHDVNDVGLADAERPPEAPVRPVHAHRQATTEHDPDGLLWAALSNAPDEGTPVPHLMLVSGMTRPTLYRRLSDLVNAGFVIQVSRGRYRAATPDDHHPM